MRCSSCGYDNLNAVDYCAQCGVVLPKVVNSNPFAENNGSFPQPIEVIQPVSNPFADTNAYSSPQTDSINPELSTPDPILPWLIPVGQSLYAVIAGYTGLLSVGCCPLGPLAILFGILAIFDIRKHPEKHGRVRAILGIILGVVGSLGLIFMIIGLLVG